MHQNHIETSVPDQSGYRESVNINFNTFPEDVSVAVQRAPTLVTSKTPLPRIFPHIPLAPRIFPYLSTVLVLRLNFTRYHTKFHVWAFLSKGLHCVLVGSFGSLSC